MIEYSIEEIDPNVLNNLLTDRKDCRIFFRREFVPQSVVRLITEEENIQISGANHYERQIIKSLSGNMQSGGAFFNLWFRAYENGALVSFTDKRDGLYSMNINFE